MCVFFVLFFLVNASHKLKVLKLRIIIGSDFVSLVYLSSRVDMSM